jgi:uncharacterized integral membrane protein
VVSFRATLFLVIAIVLAVFAVIAAASAAGTFWVTTWEVWLSSAFLAFLVDLCVVVGPVAGRRADGTVVAER